MTCVECELLFDAYLDGQLGGTLRLEFDAHRLRCRRCQQSLAMLEAVGHVVASNPQEPALPEGFTELVMQQIAQPQRVPFPTLRVAVVAGALLQAAAVLVFAIMLNLGDRSTTPALPDAGEPPVIAVVPPDGPIPPARPERAAVLAELRQTLEDRLWKMRHESTRFTDDILSLARYLNAAVPDDVLRASTKLAEGNPWQMFWNSATSPEEDEPESGVDADGSQSI